MATKRLKPEIGPRYEIPPYSKPGIHADLLEARRWLVEGTQLMQKVQSGRASKYEVDRWIDKVLGRESLGCVT